MQSIKTFLSFSFILAIIVFLFVKDNSSFNPLCEPGSEHKHQMSDLESVDEEPTQQHPHKTELNHPVYLTCIISSYKTDSDNYPSPLFDIAVPPPEC